VGEFGFPAFNADASVGQDRRGALPGIIAQTTHCCRPPVGSLCTKTGFFIGLGVWKPTRLIVWGVLHDLIAGETALIA
jgi:hypothetical protein